MSGIVDITKRYITRDGREVVIFEVSDRVYCKVREHAGWFVASLHLNGQVFLGRESGSDLVPVKTWRPWRKGEMPRHFMARHKEGGGWHIAHASELAGCFLKLFANYDRLHEGGTITPCGVCE